VTSSITVFQALLWEKKCIWSNSN